MTIFTKFVEFEEFRPLSVLNILNSLLLTGEIISITAGSDQGSYAKPLLCKRYPLTIGESLSFSTFQKMQRWLRPNSNARLEATYRYSLICRRARNDHGHHGRLILNSKEWSPRSLDEMLLKLQFEL